MRLISWSKRAGQFVYTICLCVTDSKNKDCKLCSPTIFSSKKTDTIHFKSIVWQQFLKKCRKTKSQGVTVKTQLLCKLYRKWHVPSFEFLLTWPKINWLSYFHNNRHFTYVHDYLILTPISYLLIPHLF